MPPTQVTSHGQRFPELDGLRALAVAAVVLFHCEVAGLLDAGFFGVDVFFTISGFIITAILLKDYRKTGEFGFVNFYFRRLKRLMPPVLGLIALALAFTPLISLDAYKRLVADVPAALLYYSNWWQIFEKQDYFDTTPHVLRHLWSLAVEEQFYLLWPPILYAVLKRRGARATGLVALALAVLSTLWMAWCYAQNADSPDQNRIYLGADTHAMGLLVGAALACFWNPWEARAAAPFTRHAGRMLALAALGALAAMSILINTSDPLLYQGSFLLVPLLSAIVAYFTMTDPASLLSRLLRTAPVQWVGLRSYSIYLVHWLIFTWMRLVGWTDFSHPVVLLPALVAVGLLAEVMYRCIELPTTGFNFSNPAAWPRMATFATYLVLAGGLTWASLPDEQPVSLAVAPAPVLPVPPSPVQAAAAPAAVAPAADDALDANLKISGGKEIVAIGDSVLLGASDHLSKTIPGIRIDAQVGRQASQGLKVVQQLRGKLTGESTVLLHLGTNGYINEAQFRELLNALADCKAVLVINVHAERRWTAPNNEMIERMTREFSNVRLINWSQVSAQRPEYFNKDGIHLTKKGILALATQIKLATGGEPLGPESMLASAPARPTVHQVAAVDPRLTAAPEVSAAAAAAADPTPAPANPPTPHEGETAPAESNPDKPQPAKG
ncbi:MAG: acyltransferase family protein [Gammaproteobacteria bacterium]